MSKRKTAGACAPGIRRLLVAIVVCLSVMILISCIFPWTFPYDRLDQLYGLNVESIEAGHPGGDFTLYCAPLWGEPKVELYVNGKYYTTAERITEEQYRVHLGAELFETPGMLKLMIKQTLLLPIGIRSNTAVVYVTQPQV